MLLTITCEAERATDLGYLLHKNPANLFEKEVWFGRIRVFYPEAAERRCTAALLLEVDPVNLVRGKGSTLDQYVNDRPYVASSLMSVALGEAFGTAMSGRSKERPERVGEPLPLSAHLAAVDCDAGEPLIRRLFEPLGYAVTVDRAPLDERFPSLGDSSLYSVTIKGRQTVQNLLAHLYVLIPVMDNAKHYFVDESEIDKLLRRGESWLAAHPDRELITRRYLAYRKAMVRTALERLRPDDEDLPGEEEQAARQAEEAQIEAPVRLNEWRMQAVMEAVRGGGPSPPSPLSQELERGRTAVRSVIDLGCGEGKLLRMLLDERGIEKIVGADVSPAVLARAEARMERLPERQKARVQLIQASLVYRDDRFDGFDCATLVEVIEHLDPPRLAALEQVVFLHAKPRRVIVTTPNAEYNSVWATLPAGRFRHRDHRFEWTRAEFQAWAERVAQAYAYAVRFQGIGVADPSRGAPTQMAVFDALAR